MTCSLFTEGLSGRKTAWSLCVTGAFLLAASAVHARPVGTGPEPNRVTLQVLGEGMTLSAHYERRVLWRGPFVLSMQVGLGYFPLFTNGGFAPGTVLAPIGPRLLAGDGVHHAELGLALTPMLTLDAAGRGGWALTGLSVTPSLGYRYRRAGSPWSFGLAWAPRIGRGLREVELDHVLRLEVGYSF